MRFSRPSHASQNAKFLTDNSLTHLAVSHHYIQASVDAACHNGHVPVLPAQAETVSKVTGRPISFSPPKATVAVSGSAPSALAVDKTVENHVCVAIPALGLRVMASRL